MPLPHQDSIGSLASEVPKGESVESAMAFVLEDTTTPVELIAHDRLYTGALGRATYGSASPSFPMHPLPQPGAPHTARHHYCPTAERIAEQSVGSHP